MHRYQPNIHKEKDNKNMVSCIDGWIDKGVRNDLESLTW